MSESKLVGSVPATASAVEMSIANYAIDGAARFVGAIERVLSEKR